jgi:hypothetical protein
LCSVERLNFIEGTSNACGLVASVLREEDGNAAVLEHSNKLVITSGRVGRVSATPRVGIETKELGARLISGTIVGALKVCPCVLENWPNIGCRVSNGNGSLGILCDILSEISLDGLFVLSAPIVRNEHVAKLTLMYGGFDFPVSISFITSFAEKKAIVLG